MAFTSGHLHPSMDKDGKQYVVPTPKSAKFKTWFVGRADQLSPLKRGGGTQILLKFEITALTGTWTWDGTTTVLSDDTSQVAVNDWVRLKADNQWFKITGITPNTSVTIENPDGLTIPSGSTDPEFIPHKLSQEFQFAEPVEVHDGQGQSRPVANFDLEDEAEFCLRLPATVVTPNAGNGNCNLSDQGGYNALVPAPLTDGSHDVVLADAVPVMVADEDNPNGLWHVDKNTGVVTPVANPNAPDGNCNLLDVENTAFMVRGLGIGTEYGILDIDVYNVEWMHQNWIAKWSVTKVLPTEGKVRMWLLCFRENVTES